MSLRWQIFRVICFLQMLLTIYFAFTSLINMFNITFLNYFFQLISFVLSACLAILGINMLNNNYPDKPVAGQQKSIFNWLFILNFLLLSFLFGLIFSEYRQLEFIGRVLYRRPLSLPFGITHVFYLNILMLVFQIIVLYGMYSLRRTLYMNAVGTKQFEFED